MAKKVKPTAGKPKRRKPLTGDQVDASVDALLTQTLDVEPVVEKTHKGLPVSGYTEQPDHRVVAVNVHKEMEERLLRRIDDLFATGEDYYDRRWLSEAKTDFEKGFMALNRAIFKPKRIMLPEDKGSNDGPTPKPQP